MATNYKQQPTRLAPGRKNKVTYKDAKKDIAIIRKNYQQEFRKLVQSQEYPEKFINGIIIRTSDTPISDIFK